MNDIDYLKEQVSIMINLFKTKRFDSLINKGITLIRKFPDQAILYNITSLAYNAVGKSTKAKILLIKILKKYPRDINVLNNLGLVSTRCGDIENAESYYLKALKQNPGFVDALTNLGNLKLNQNKNEEAKGFFIKAIKINNKILPARMSLAAYYEQSGNFEKAKKLYTEILTFDPNYNIADKSLSLIHKYTHKDEHLKTMEEKVKVNKDEEGVRWLYFALGKAYEDIEDYKKSFKFYEAGNKLYRDTVTYDFKDEEEYFKKIKLFFTNHNIEPIDDYGQKLIFIVGMPRSGTTLAEQILSSHKNIVGAGELNFLKEAIEKKLFNQNENISSGYEKLKPEILKEIKDYYLKKIATYKDEKEHLIDKAPLNFKWIGFIMAIFPNSKIIHCSRNPMDICWSNYKNTFSSKSMNYSYDFNDLANFYKIYDDLMNFWINKFNNKIFNLVYEDLIIDKELETKKLLTFCGLDWDKNCLNFHNNKKTVSTASLAQVRQPIYNSSVKKWENYSKELEFLRKKLDT